VALIEFRSVQKAFGEKRVYTDLSLDIFEGESITIIGGSGMGKSVALKLLIGLLDADSGSIVFDGIQIVNAKPQTLTEVRRRIGMLFQGAALFDSLSVGENVAYGLREHFKMSEEEIAARVHESLDSVGLPGIEAMWPADLSGGMKKRVGLARAIAVRPEVILYDEPTTGLDPINVTRINRLILDLQHKLEVTSVVVTHDLASAFHVSDRIAMIDEGVVIFQGTVDEIRHTDVRKVRDFIEGNAEDLDAAGLLERGG
jgi:phospholipid/cholesterol/gamma-HCH transport system ATP-binding protein